MKRWGKGKIPFQLTFGPSDEGQKGFCHPHSAPEVHFCHLLVGLHAGELHISESRDARVVNQAPHAWTGWNRTAVTAQPWPQTSPIGLQPIPLPASVPFPQTLPLLIQGSGTLSRVTKNEQRGQKCCDSPLSLKGPVIISLLPPWTPWAPTMTQPCQVAPAPSPTRANSFPLCSMLSCPCTPHPAPSVHPCLCTFTCIPPEAGRTRGVFRAKPSLEDQGRTQHPRSCSS